MKKLEMKDSHCPLWIGSAFAFHVGMYLLTITIFPTLTEVGKGAVACLGLIPTGLIVSTAMWAIYTNFGKEHPEG